MLSGSRLRQSTMKDYRSEKARWSVLAPKNFSMRPRIPAKGVIYLGRAIKAQAFRPENEAHCEHTCAAIGT